MKPRHKRSILSAVVNADGRCGTVAQQQALDLGWSPLDSLNIQTRVVSRMRSHAPTEAWRLLQQITLPTRRSTCKDSLTETFSPYYEVMAGTLRSVPGPVLSDGETKTAYLSDLATRLNTSAQAQAFISSLAAMDISAQDLSPVLDRLVSRLPLLEGSDRDMYGAENGKAE